MKMKSNFKGKKALAELQELVDKWINQFEEGYWPPLSQLASIMEEVGEISRIINALEGYKKFKPNEKVEPLEDELGDLLFSLICLANYYKIDLEKAFFKILKKYNERDVNRWTLKK